MGRDHLDHGAQIGVELADMQLALTGEAALAGEFGEALEIGEQHRHIQQASPQDSLGRLGIRQDFGHHPRGHIALKGAAQAAPFPLLQQVGVSGIHQGQQPQAGRRSQQWQPQLPLPQGPASPRQLQPQHRTDHRQAPGQGAAGQGQAGGQQQHQGDQQGPLPVAGRPGAQPIPLQGIGRGGGQQLQPRQRAEGGGIAVIALAHHGTEHHQCPGQVRPLGMAAPAAGIEHLPGR